MPVVMGETEKGRERGGRIHKLRRLRSGRQRLRWMTNWRQPLCLVVTAIATSINFSFSSRWLLLYQRQESTTLVVTTLGKATKCTRLALFVWTYISLRNVETALHFSCNDARKRVENTDLSTIIIVIAIVLPKDKSWAIKWSWAAKEAQKRVCSFVSH